MATPKQNSDTALQYLEHYIPTYSDVNGLLDDYIGGGVELKSNRIKKAIGALQEQVDQIEKEHQADQSNRDQTAPLLAALSELRSDGRKFILPGSNQIDIIVDPPNSGTGTGPPSKMEARIARLASRRFFSYFMRVIPILKTKITQITSLRYYL